MVDNDNIGRRELSRLFRKSAGMAACCGVLLGTAFPCNVYAEAKEPAASHIDDVESADVHGGSQFRSKNLATHVTFEAPVLGSAPNRIDTGLSDVAQLDTSMEEQNSPPVLVASKEVQSLDVIDTGSSVDVPQAVVDVNGDQHVSQKVIVDAVDQMIAASPDMVDQGDRLATGSDDVLSITSVREEDQTRDASVRQSQDSKKNDRSEGASRNASSEEDSAGLPYAVLLALLALIGLVPVARRNDHHRI